ncbi:MAG: MYXO-CTERM sorting domain-containing protein, partial [Myxococcales bacterium]|nr:MYXO-CTERM sorting domain-containing protein [Myxococcales bacterium]
ELCGLADFQNDVALLHMLFGDPYVDDRAPTLELIEPEDGAYFQGPASFDVILEVHDDTHPQTYELAIGVPGLVDNPEFRSVIDPSFEVAALPLGTWTFELRLRDESGNEAALAFTVEVGEDPPPAVDAASGCACTLEGQEDGTPAPWTLLALLALPVLTRRRPWTPTRG